MAREKVISLRVNAEEYEAIKNEIGGVIRLHENGVIRSKTVGDVLRYWVNLNIEGAVSRLRKQQKAEATKAKRRATLEAKKAANDTK